MLAYVRVGLPQRATELSTLAREHDRPRAGWEQDSFSFHLKWKRDSFTPTGLGLGVNPTKG